MNGSMGPWAIYFIFMMKFGLLALVGIRIKCGGIDGSA